MAATPVKLNLLLLERDELEEEMRLRNITDHDKIGISELIAKLEQEGAGNAVAPTALPTTAWASEYRICRNKFDVLYRLVTTDPVNASLQVRMWHLGQRLNRMKLANPDADNVLSLITQYSTMKDQLNLVIRTGSRPKQHVTAAATANTDTADISGNQSDFHGFSPIPAAYQSATDANNQATGGPAPVVNTHPAHTDAWPIRQRHIPAYNPAVPPPEVRGHAAPVEPAVGVEYRPRGFMGNAMARWPIRFNGIIKDLSIEQFIFRVENMAAADGISRATLTLGIHFLLTGKAADFFWVYREKNPEATWEQLKAALKARYATQHKDVEIRREIADRKQAAGESFGEFVTSVESLAARLRRRMEEDELIENLRQNMSHRLQTALMMHQDLTLPELEEHCIRFERLWNSQADYMKRPVAMRPRVNELLEADNFRVQAKQDDMMDAIEALQIRPAIAAIGNRNDYIICWNCKDLGHNFKDCLTKIDHVFCFGCGAENVYRPQCTKCAAGNGKRDVLGGVRRPNPFTPKTL